MLVQNKFYEICNINFNEKNVIFSKERLRVMMNINYTINSILISLHNIKIFSFIINNLIVLKDWDTYMKISSSLVITSLQPSEKNSCVKYF